MATRKKTKAKTKPAKARHHRAATSHGHHKPANSNEPSLSSRPSWQGNLRLSLVSCPVALFGATSRTSDISFHLLNPETNHRGTIVPGPAYQTGGATCREFSHTMYIENKPQIVRSTACRNPDGSWSPVG